jgi:hypothetical protein
MSAAPLPVIFRTSRLLCCLFLCCALSMNLGCMRMQPLARAGIDSPAIEASDLALLEPGDRVRVRTRDGQQRELDFRALQADRLVVVDRASGEGFAIGLDDIQELERRRVDVGRTVALVLVLAASWALVAQASGSSAASVVVP